MFSGITVRIKQSLISDILKYKFNEKIRALSHFDFAKIHFQKEFILYGRDKVSQSTFSGTAASAEYHHIVSRTDIKMSTGIP